MLICSGCFFICSFPEKILKKTKMDFDICKLSTSVYIVVRQWQWFLDADLFNVFLRVLTSKIKMPSNCKNSVIKCNMVYLYI
jgi:hypothetical protein